MKSMLRKGLALILTGLCLFSMIPQVFAASDDWKISSLSDGTVQIDSYNGHDTVVNVPKSVDGKTVSGIGSKAFLYNKKITTVILPDTVTYIGALAFCDCESLTKISIPDSVTHIGDWAFSECDKLESITIPNNVSSIGVNPFEKSPVTITISPKHPVFAVIDDVLFEKQTKRLISYPYGCENSAYEIPNGILEIGDGAFNCCIKLKEVSIPETVTTIGKGAFEGCIYLTSVNMTDGVTSIGGSAFHDCKSLENITISNSLTSISRAVFLNCTGLTSITIPDSVTSIEQDAFTGCKNLTSIILPNSVTYIGDTAFESCSSLTDIIIPDSVSSLGINPFCDTAVAINVSPEHPFLEVIDGVLFEKQTKKLVSYPFGCENSDYEIPEGTLEIGTYAFYHCSKLNIVSIPDSLQTIDDHAFYWCKNLTSVSIPGSVMSMGYEVFDSCGDSLEITVEADSCAEAYCQKHHLNYIYSESADLDWLNG